MKRIWLASITVGFLLMLPLAALFNTMNWPLFHSWGLAHGSFVIAWPVLTILSFGLIRILARLWVLAGKF